MKSTGTLYARVSDAEIRKSAKGRDYLSIKGELLDAEQARKGGPVWITSFHKTHIGAGIRPGMEIEARGAFDYARDSENKPRLWLTADFIALLLSVPVQEAVTESPLPSAQPAGKKVGGHARSETKALTMPVDSSVLAPGFGSAMAASRFSVPVPPFEKPASKQQVPNLAALDFEPRSKPKLTEVERFGLQFPGEASAKYGKGLDWQKGDDIADLF